MWFNHQRSADDLIAQVADDSWGSVGLSYYDTARLVAIAPWLDGHHARLDYLLTRQNADGGWGGPDGYAVVPTLSTVAALLTEARRQPGQTRHAQLRRAAAAGLHTLRRWLDPERPMTIPDTIGVELIVPALIDDINQLTPANLPLPNGFDHRTLLAYRDRFRSGTLSQRAWACLEVVGAEAAGSPAIRPVDGAVGCSAAATAAWLGDSGPGDDFLTRLQAKGGGAVPAVTPISYFEPAWVLNSLAVAGLVGTVPVRVLQRLETALTPGGAPAAPGLPPDSDDTAAVLSALLRSGRIHAPDSLLGYATDGYFTCFPDERNPSVSTNAHIVETLALYLRRRPERDKLSGPAGMAAQWLLDQQASDGSWLDKWHASPYYATSCCVLALRLHGTGTGAIGRATDWLLASQHTDGGWGRWGSTVEETAYAVQVLAGTGHADAIKRGCAYLAGVDTLAEHPPLWHAKDLYAPLAVIRAAQLAALHLGAPSGIPANLSAA